MGVGWCCGVLRGFFDPSPPLKSPSEPPSPPSKDPPTPSPPHKRPSYPLPLPLPSPQNTPLQAPASPCKPFRLPHPPKKPPKAPKSPTKPPKAPPLSDMYHHPPPPRRRRGRGGWGGGVRGLPVHKHDTTARKTRQKRALVTFACPPPAWGEGGYRGRGAGTYPPPTYTPHPRHHTRAKMELPTATIHPPLPPPYPGKNGTTHRNHTTPTPTNHPPAPLFLGGGRGQKSPSVPRSTTPPPYRAALPRAPTEGEPHGWSRRGTERAGRAAWVVAERSGASRARRMASRERSERCSSWVGGYPSARCPLAPLAQRRASGHPPPLRSAAW